MEILLLRVIQHFELKCLVNGVWYDTIFREENSRSVWHNDSKRQL